MSVSRRNNFDFIRLCLAVAVIFSHSFPLGTGLEASEPVAVLTHGQTTAGAIAVDLFFIMSGYLITASFENSASPWRFLEKRIRRIYPGFLAAMLVSVGVVVPLASARLGGAGLTDQFVNFFGNTLRLREFASSGGFAHNAFPGALNGSVWSISYEFWCYIGVLLLGVFRVLGRRRLMALIFWLSWATSIVVAIRDWRPGNSIPGMIFGYPPFWARLLPMYLSGVLFYIYRRQIALTWRGLVIAGATLALACWIPFGWTLVFPLAGAYLLFAAAFTASGRFSGFAAHGDFSYGTYLYAFPIQQILLQALGGRANPYLLFAAATPISLVVAIGSWHCVEKRFLRSNRRIASVAARAELSAAAAAD
ncbi:MAG: acyltransferase [Acidobacteriia bacterium]|nr:acyltransferase [Terriglobia bacterium]